MINICYIRLRRPKTWSSETMNEMTILVWIYIFWNATGLMCKFLLLCFGRGLVRSFCIIHPVAVCLNASSIHKDEARWLRSRWFLPISYYTVFWVVPPARNSCQPLCLLWMTNKNYLSSFNRVSLLYRVLCHASNLILVTPCIII